MIFAFLIRAANQFWQTSLSADLVHFMPGIWNMYGVAVDGEEQEIIYVLY